MIEVENCFFQLSISTILIAPNLASKLLVQPIALAKPLIEYPCQSLHESTTTSKRKASKCYAISVQLMPILDWRLPSHQNIEMRKRISVAYIYLAK